MSEDNDPSRNAEIKIIHEEGTTFFQIKVAFLGHITAAIRWDDSEEEGRSDVCALLRDSVKMAKDAFLEIEIDREACGIDAELEALFGPDEVDEEVETDE